MAGIRSMLARVRRIEEARTPALSPIAAGWGSFDASAAWADEQMADGGLDQGFSDVVAAFGKWERDGTWGQRASPAGVWRPAS